SRRRHTRFSRDWSSDVCSSDLDHRRRQLRDLALLTHDDLFSTALIALHRMHAKLVDEMREIPDALRPFRYIAFRDNAEQRSLQREENGRFNEKRKSAVSEGENPFTARAREISPK